MSDEMVTVGVVADGANNPNDKKDMLSKYGCIFKSKMNELEFNWFYHRYKFEINCVKVCEKYPNILSIPDLLEYYQSNYTDKKTLNYIKNLKDETTNR